MPRTIETKLYQYSELSDKAKERARDWWLSCRDSHDYSAVIEDAVEIGELLGLEFRTETVRLYGGGTRQKPRVYWSLSYSQGDGASFDALYRYRKGAAKAIREHAPKDEKLHRIADELQAAQRRAFYSAEVECSEYRGNMRFALSEDGKAFPVGVESDIADALRAFAGWIYDQLRAEDEHLCSEEQIAEAMEANEYEFTEEGERA